MDKGPKNGKKGTLIKSRKKRYGIYQSALQKQKGNSDEKSSQTMPKKEGASQPKQDMKDIVRKAFDLELTGKDTERQTTKKISEKEASNRSISSFEKPKKKNRLQDDTIQTESRKKPEEKKTAEKKTVEKKPVEKKTAEKKTAEKKPVEKKPVEKKTVEKKPVEKKPVEKKPVEKKPVEKKPVEKKPVEKKPEERKELERKKAEKKADEQRSAEKKGEEKKETGKKAEEKKEAEEKVLENKVYKKKAEEKKIVFSHPDQSLQDMVENLEEEFPLYEEAAEEKKKDPLTVTKMISLIVFDIGWAALVICAVLWFFDAGYAGKKGESTKKAQDMTETVDTTSEEEEDSSTDDLSAEGNLAGEISSEESETDSKSGTSKKKKKKTKNTDEADKSEENTTTEQTSKTDQDEAEKQEEDIEKNSKDSETEPESSSKKTYDNVYIVKNGKLVKAGNLYMTETEMLQKTFEYQKLEAGSVVDVAAFNAERIHDMFYAEEIDDTVFGRIYGKSFQENSIITKENLRYLRMLYYGFDEETHIGEMIVNEKIAEDVLAIFEELYLQDYPIEKMVLVDEYDADDEKSMAANNTSGFNLRYIANTTTYSQHAYGMAVDVNPKYNPYITYASDGSWIIAPKNGEKYAGRDNSFAHKIDQNDLCYQLFTQHGFSWGGSWSSSKDYQHFERKY